MFGFTRKTHLSIVILVTLMLIGCSTSPRVPVTPPPGYQRYVPAKDSPIQLEFNYPETWRVAITENRMNDATVKGGLMNIFTDFVTVKITQTIESYTVSEDAQRIVMSVNCQLYLNAGERERYQKYFSDIESAEPYLQSRGAIVESRNVVIDGHPALMVVEEVSNYIASRMTPIVGEAREVTVYLVLDDRYYAFYLQVVPVDWKDSPYEQAFMDLLASVKIVR